MEMESGNDLEDLSRPFSTRKWVKSNYKQTMNYSLLSQMHLLHASMVCPYQTERLVRCLQVNTQFMRVVSIITIHSKRTEWRDSLENNTAT